MKPIEQQTMQKAEKAGGVETIFRQGTQLCIAWGRVVPGRKGGPRYSCHTEHTETAGQARRAEEMLELKVFDASAMTPIGKLRAAVLFAGAERAAAQIRCRRRG